jgi:predicted kinase
MRMSAPPSQLLLVQMAGPPGSGKSALARALGRALGMVVIDKDVIKTTLLEAEISWEAAGAAAQGTAFALAESLLDQGVSVVLDSPSYYDVIPLRGLAVAGEAGATYRCIECRCDDLEEIARRLAGRVPRRSQWTGLSAQAPDGVSRAEQVGPHRWRTYGPDGGWLVLDTRQSLPISLAAALKYLAAG